MLRQSPASTFGWLLRSPYLARSWAITSAIGLDQDTATHFCCDTASVLVFLRHGAKVVFLGRFVALLRILAAFLAGLNRMPWRAFLTANAIGGAIWAAVFGLGGFMFGKALLQLHHALAPIVFALALAGFFGCGYLIRRYEDRLTALAERALPGPLVAALHVKKP